MSLPNETHFCHACGDRCAGAKVEGREGLFCHDCHAELVHGKIKNQNIAMSGGSRGRLDEDAGSYRTIAVRHMEDHE